MEQMKTLNGREIVDGWAREQIGYINGATNDPTDAKYFDIDENGVVSLKAQYRGCPSDSTYSFAVSGNGVGVNGSEFHNLPKRIVLPEVINNIAVTGFADGMFYENYAVEEIVFPSTVTTVPAYFCYWAKRLRAIKNTEHITSIGDYCFSKTRVEEAIFPRLKTIGERAFWCCGFLHTANIGNEVTDLALRCFMNTKLSTVIGGESVTTIGDYAFYGTHYLTRLPFLDLLKVTSIGDGAFTNSHVQFDWSKLVDCSFDTASTPVVDNTTDYWSNIIGNGYFTPCENPIVTAFHQKHPLWKDDLWFDTGKGFNCAMMSVIHIHSALTGKKYATPYEFKEEVEASYPALKNIHPGTGAERITFIEGLGYTTETYTSLTDEVFRDLLDALKEGALAYVSVGAGTNTNSGHGVVAYGVADNGDIMFLDSDVTEYNVDLFDVGLTYAMPLQNTTGPASPIIIVRKPKEE